MEAARVMEKLRRDAEPGELDFKVLYGLEAVLEDGCLIHLLVQHQEGLAQLYRLLEIARQGREERPFLRKAEVSEHRTGLLVGCPGEGGEGNSLWGQHLVGEPSRATRSRPSHFLGEIVNINQVSSRCSAGVSQALSHRPTLPARWDKPRAG